MLQEPTFALNMKKNEKLNAAQEYDFKFPQKRQQTPWLRSLS